METGTMARVPTRKKEIASGVVALAFGLYVLIEAMHLRDFGTSALSPGVVPFAVGICVVFLSGVFLVGAIRAALGKPSPGKNDERSEGVSEEFFNARIAVTIFLVFLYVISLNFVSFLVSSPIFLVLSMTILRKKYDLKNMVSIIVLSIVVAFAIRFVFRDIFQLYFI